MAQTPRVLRRRPDSGLHGRLAAIQTPPMSLSKSSVKQQLAQNQTEKRLIDVRTEVSGAGARHCHLPSLASLWTRTVWSRSTGANDRLSNAYSLAVSSPVTYIKDPVTGSLSIATFSRSADQMRSMGAFGDCTSNSRMNAQSFPSSGSTVKP